MLGRKECTREEFDHGKAAIDSQLAAYRQLTGALGNDGVFRGNLNDVRASLVTTVPWVPVLARRPRLAPAPRFVRDQPGWPPC
jgi:hypothetical protein